MELSEIGYFNTVSYNVDGTIKAFLNVCESLLMILLVHQHVNGCSHCFEVKNSFAVQSKLLGLLKS